MSKRIETAQSEKAVCLSAQALPCCCCCYSHCVKIFLTSIKYPPWQPCELALDLQFALHIRHIFPWPSEALTYCGPALQFYIGSNFQLSCFFQYPHWPAGVSTELPPCLASQLWLSYAISSLTLPCYQNHVSSPCISNLPSHKLAKESDVMLNAMIRPWSTGTYADILCD